LEVDYFLRDERQAMQAFMQNLARGAFMHKPPAPGQLSRAMKVDRSFADLALGLVDATGGAGRVVGHPMLLTVDEAAALLRTTCQQRDTEPLFS
jgi:hypothetical protein